MANEDQGSKPGRKQPEGERWFSQQQYDRLLRCSEKKDITEWNNWRKENPDEEILLQGADLNNAHLENAYLREAHLENANLRQAHLENAILKGVHLENSDLQYSHLEDAYLIEAHLENTNLLGAHLENAILVRSYLVGAHLERAHLGRANFEGASLQNSVLWEAELQGANLRKTCLQNVKLMRANLQGTEFGRAKLQNADFSRAIVDGRTLIWGCEVNRKTKFEGVALGNLRIYPNIKQLLEYNVRRKNWEQWYKEHWLLQWPGKLFWSFSDYGMSTRRVLVTFLGFALIFANIYYYWGRIAPPGIVDTLFVDRNGIEVELCLVPLRALYFSIVTMTTLGFGDMYANAHSIFGHILLSFQVILGYVLLGVMVTRFAVLFTSGGPAGKFSPIKTKETAVDKKNEGEQ